MRKQNTQCYATIFGGNTFRVKLEYESKPENVLHVSYYSQETLQFERCFAMKADLSFSGIFLITASSGFRQPTYYTVKSFKIWDSKTEVLNTRF